MGSIDPEVRRALDLRYANGEITTKEYWHLKAVLTLGAEENISRANPPEPQEQPLLILEDLVIYPTYLVIAQKRLELSDIVSVEGGAVNLQLNLFSAIRDTSLTVSFRNGFTYRLREERPRSGGDRHNAIIRATQLLRHLTFRPLFDRLVSEVRNSRVPIGVENSTPISSVPEILWRMIRPVTPAAVFLHRDGTISNGALALNLKQCRREGTLEFGIHRTNLNEPESVYASNKKRVMERSHSQTLRFGLGGNHRPDVVMALLNWMAEPDNDL